MDWECDSSCMTDSDDGLESWQNQLYELHGHRCARITKSLRWLSSQTRTLPVSESSTDPEESSVPTPIQMLELQKSENLESASGVTATSRWTAHKQYLPSWEDCPTSLYL